LENSTKRQEEIIKIAFLLILQKGIQGLTIKNIAQNLGISQPAIYRHYESKIEILLSILDVFRDNAKQIFEIANASEDKAIKKIEQLFDAHFLLFSKTPSLVAVIFSEEIFRNEPILVEKISKIMKDCGDILINIIEKGQKENELIDNVPAEDLAIVIMGSLRLFVKKWQMAKFSFDITGKGEAFFETVKTLIIAKKGGGRGNENN